jgi:hypothetical protein
LVSRMSDTHSQKMAYFSNTGDIDLFGRLI